MCQQQNQIIRISMNDDSKSRFRKLQDETHDIHYRWKMYREVYAGDAEQFKILNSCGSNFFYYVQHLMLDHVALTFSKLTDPNKQRGIKNLSLMHITSKMIDPHDKALAGEVGKMINDLKEYCIVFRKLRNKRIAHMDLAHTMKATEEPLPGISRQYVEGALEQLRVILNTVEEHYKMDIISYEKVMASHDASATHLMNKLKEANKSV